jgi:UDP-N-acetylmuramoylalanine--D-glutamate ligase
LFSFNHAKILGEHNKENFLFAYKGIKASGVKFSNEEYQNFINSYGGVEHRLEFVGEASGLRVYNDSKSTNIKATEIAVRAFDKDVYLILGGSNKYISIYSQLKDFKQIKEILLIGESSSFLQDDLAKLKPKSFSDLEELLNYMKGSKGNLLFSPAHQSFDKYKNFEHRGEEFKSLAFKMLFS